MSHLIPTDEELKEFYLCTLRSNQSSVLGIEPCPYCKKYHFIPVHADETHLIIDAKQAFLRYLENQFHVTPRQISSLETSSIIILGSN